MLDLDPKLSRKLQGIGEGHASDKVPFDEIPGDLFFGECDSLVVFPVKSIGQTRIRTLLRFLCSGAHVWHVSDGSPSGFDWICSVVGLSATPMTVWQMERDNLFNFRLVFWSRDVLRDHLQEIAQREIGLPDRLVLDGRTAFKDNEAATCLEEICLRFPFGIPLILLLESVSNVNEISGWLEVIRKRQCKVWRVPEAQYPVLVPAFLDSDKSLTLLMQERKVANRVKQILKEKEPYSKNISDFIPELATVIRKMEWLPAIIIMSDDHACAKALDLCSNQPSCIGESERQDLNSLIESYPVLRDDSRLETIQAKRALIIFRGDYFAWVILAKHLLVSGQCDLVFTTVGKACLLEGLVRTVALLTVKQTLPDNFNHDGLFGKGDGNCLRRCPGRIGIDSTAILLAVHTREMDVYYLRDILDAKPIEIVSHFHITPQRLPGLLAWEEAESSFFPDKTFAFFQGSSNTREQLDDLLTKLETELPEARCISPRAMLALRESHLYLDFKINEISHQPLVRKRPQYRGKLDKFESEYSHLPCWKCSHQNDCHHRGSKKLRVIIEEFYSFMRSARGTASLLWMERKNGLDLLNALGLTDGSDRLTGSGHLCVGISGQYSLLLPVCVGSGLIPLDNPDLAWAVVAGFVEHPDLEGIQLAKELLDQRIIDVYQKLEHVLQTYIPKAACTGFLVDPPSKACAVAVWAWSHGHDLDAIARQTHLSRNALDYLIETSVYLTSRLRHGLRKIDSSHNDDLSC
ncbi:MAG: hypothetical protein HQL78_11800 [Magnetococcales bacterium]|nr:hypothetical protein [Magnetococcales bacterium]